MSTTPQEDGWARLLVRRGLPYAVVLGAAAWVTRGPRYGALVASLCIGSFLAGYAVLFRTGRRVAVVPAAVAGAVVGFAVLLALR